MAMSHVETIKGKGKSRQMEVLLRGLASECRDLVYHCGGSRGNMLLRFCEPRGEVKRFIDGDERNVCHGSQEITDTKGPRDSLLLSDIETIKDDCIFTFDRNKIKQNKH